MKATSAHLICPLCDKPVALTAAKTDGEGKAVHEDCYVRAQQQASKKSA